MIIIIYIDSVVVFHCQLLMFCCHISLSVICILMCEFAVLFISCRHIVIVVYLRSQMMTSLRQNDDSHCLSG